MNNQKIDNQLNLALNLNKKELNASENLKVGYDEKENVWEVIIKYNGDILKIGKKFNAKTEILTNKYAIMTIKEEFINSLALEEEIEFVEKPTSLGLNLNDSLPAACISQVQKFKPYELKGNGVLLGIIDTGIDYSHPDFRNEDGTTRIKFLWDQTIEGNPPQGFIEGTEYTSDQLNKALEEKNLQKRYEIVPSQDFLKHGTHVAGIAGGNGRASKGKYIGAAPEAEFIIVKLGTKGVESFPRTTELMRGIKYVIEKAEELKMPVAVNISFGNNSGSHDGNSLFETYIDEFSNQWKNVIVVGSGNEGANPIHTSGIIEEMQEQDVQVNIGERETSVDIQIWKNYFDDMQISLGAPDGTVTGFISKTLGTQRFNLMNTEILLYYGEPNPYNKSQQIYIELLPSNEYIDKGIWTIQMKGMDIVEGKYDMWLPIAKVLNEETGFTKPTVETTLTVPSTSSKVITVGAYNSDIDSIAPFSGRGYTRSTSIKKPDIVAPGENIMAPVPGGGYDSFSGTSMATPFATGASALLMEWGIVKENDPFLYGEKVKAYLIDGAKRDENREYPNPVWGYGRLCLFNSLREARSDMSKLLSRNDEQNQQMTCSSKVISEDCIDIIVEYDQDIEQVAKKFGTDCYQIIDNQYAVLFVKNGEKTCVEAYKSIPYNEIPSLYGPYAKDSLQASQILIFHNQPYIPLRGEGVLVAIIDSGIDYTHPVFVYEDNTSKIVSMWDQTGEGNPPKGIIYGTEYGNEDINNALNSQNPFDIVKEYDELGHGTFLAGIAAGLEDEENNFVGGAPGSELIVVKLKEAKKCLREYYTVNEGEPVYQASDIMLGIRYAVEKANELQRPLVILVGLGSNEGAHDGTSIIERYLLRIGNVNGIAAIVAAGNEAEKQHHLSGQFNEEVKIERFEVSVAEGEKGFTLNIWNHAPDKMSVAITSPSGEYIDRIPARLSEKEEIELILENTKILVEYQISEARTGDQAIFIRFEDPTPGIWTISLYGDVIVDGRYDVWLPREGWIKENTVFLEPDPYTTMTVPASSIGVISVGGYDHVSDSLYLSSGRGLTRDEELKPDLVAPGVNVIGPYPRGQYGVKTGTSVAAATVTAAAALLLQWGILEGNDMKMNTRKVRNYLIRGANRKKNIKYPNREWGYGSLNLLDTFKSIRST